MKKPDWLTASLVVGALCGSLAGAVFTWWVSREVDTVIGYTVSTTSTGTDAAGPLVKDLSLRIGDRPIPAIHTHAIEVRAVSGTTDRIALAIDFGRKVEIFGNAPRAPSSIHYINDFDVLDNGVRCTLTPMDGQGSYRFILATDVASPPTLTITGHNVQLRSLAEIAAQSTALPWYQRLLIVAMAVSTFLMVLHIAIQRVRAAYAQLRD